VLFEEGRSDKPDANEPVASNQHRRDIPMQATDKHTPYWPWAILALPIIGWGCAALIVWLS